MKQLMKGLENSLAANRLPVEHSRVEVVSKGGAKDPFLYNPRLKAVAGSKVGCLNAFTLRFRLIAGLQTLLVANEQVDVFVTMKNPLAFDLEIQDLSLL